MFVEFSLKSVILSWLGEIFKFLFIFEGNTFVSHKIRPLCFYLCFPVRISPIVLLITPTYKEITHSAPGRIFQIPVSPSRYGVRRNSENNNWIYIRNKKLKVEAKFVLVKGILFLKWYKSDPFCHFAPPYPNRLAI